MKRIFLIVRIPRPDIVSTCSGVCPLPEGVTEKHQIAEKQGPENGVACQKAAEQYKGKDDDDNSFHKISPAAERRNF